MPLYEYECDACRQRFEVIRKFSDPPLETCTSCGKGPINRLPSSPAIQFKGSGFYITDYAKKGEGGRSDKTSTEKTQDAKSDAAAAGKAGKTENKSEATAETAAKTDAPAKSEAPAKGDAPAKPPPSSSAPSGGSNN